MPSGIRRTGLLATTAASRGGRPLQASRTREDRFFSRVALLCPFNGADNGTTFTDVGPSALTVTRAGGTPPVTKTDQSVFAGSSGYFGGAGYLNLASDLDAGAFLGEDFTIEAWIRPANVTGNKIIVSLWPATSTAAWRFLALGNALNFGWTNAAGTTDGVSGTASLSSNTWSHVAVVRSGSAMSVYCDGARTGTGTLSAKIRTSSGAIQIGRNEDGNTWYWNGHMAEVRITKGVARYTGTAYQLPAFPHPVR